MRYFIQSKAVIHCDDGFAGYGLCGLSLDECQEIGIDGCGFGGGHPMGEAGIAPPVVADPLRDFCAGAVEAIEGHGEVLVELGAVGGGTLAELIDDGQGNAIGVRFALDHDRGSPVKFGEAIWK